MNLISNSEDYVSFTSNPEADVDGTSFHDVTIRCNFDLLVKKLGEPHSVGSYEDKVRYEWRFTSDDGRNVTLYDWKAYSDKPNIWHVGGLFKPDTEMFRDWFNKL